MNTATKKKNPKATKKWDCFASLAMTAVVILCLSLTGCPPAAKKPPVKKPKARPEEVKKPEVSKPSQQDQTQTPQRKASDRLIDKGKISLDAKRYDQAGQLFQDATTVDPSNGVAYYYLALTDHYLGQDSAASGLLDKAESLLRYDQHWMGKIEELRSLVTGEKPPVAPLPPVIDQY